MKTIGLLGSTALMFLVGPEDSPVPRYYTTTLHALATVHLTPDDT